MWRVEVRHRRRTLEKSKGGFQMKDFAEKLLNGFIRFASTKAVTALKDGFVLTMPATLVGSLFMLLANLPFDGYTDFMNKYLGENWNVGLNQVSAGTFNILALIIAVGIGYAYARNEKQDGISSGLLALISFIILSPSSLAIDNSTVPELAKGKSAEVANVISTSWTGGNGVITAIIVGLITGLIFTKCMKHNLRIKLPEAVPEGVSNAFSAMIPGFIVVLCSAVVYHLCKVFGGVSFTELIFKILQIPMQNLTDNWAGAIIITLLISVLFWCGIHGPNVVMGIMAPLLTANSLANQSLMDAGKAVTVANGGHILTPQIIDCFVKFGGTGITIGMLIAALMVGQIEPDQGNLQAVDCSWNFQHQRTGHLRIADCFQPLPADSLHSGSADFHGHHLWSDGHRLPGSVRSGAGSMDHASGHLRLPVGRVEGRVDSDHHPGDFGRDLLPLHQEAGCSAVRPGTGQCAGRIRGCRKGRRSGNCSGRACKGLAPRISRTNK
jgi:cellobiose PTS system EIIC component